MGRNKTRGQEINYSSTVNKSEKNMIKSYNVNKPELLIYYKVYPEKVQLLLI